jgi:hypothetical protein
MTSISIFEFNMGNNAANVALSLVTRPSAPNEWRK